MAGLGREDALARLAHLSLVTGCAAASGGASEFPRGASGGRGGGGSEVGEGEERACTAPIGGRVQSRS